MRILSSESELKWPGIMNMHHESMNNWLMGDVCAFVLSLSSGVTYYNTIDVLQAFKALDNKTVLLYIHSHMLKGLLDSDPKGTIWITLLNLLTPTHVPWTLSAHTHKAISYLKPIFESLQAWLGTLQTHRKQTHRKTEEKITCKSCLGMPLGERGTTVAGSWSLLPAPLPICLLLPATSTDIVQVSPALAQAAGLPSNHVNTR